MGIGLQSPAPALQQGLCLYSEFCLQLGWHCVPVTFRSLGMRATPSGWSKDSSKAAPSALYSVYLVPKWTSNESLAAHKLSKLVFFQQSCKESDTVTQIQDLEPQIKMVVVLPF